MRIMCYLCIGMLLPVPDRPNKTAWCPPPSSGELQPPLSSDSDTSIVTGMEVGVSDLGLSLEPQSEVFAKS